MQNNGEKIVTTRRFTAFCPRRADVWTPRSQSTYSNLQIPVKFVVSEPYSSNCFTLSSLSLHTFTLYYYYCCLFLHTRREREGIILLSSSSEQECSSPTAAGQSFSVQGVALLPVCVCVCVYLMNITNIPSFTPTTTIILSLNLFLTGILFTLTFIYI